MASAHGLPHSFIELRVIAGGISGTVLVQAADLASDIHVGNPEALLGEVFVESHIREIHESLSKRLRVLADSKQIEPVWSDAFEIVKDEKSVRLHFTVERSWAPEKIQVVGPLYAQDKLHRTFVTIYENDLIKVNEVLTEDHAVVEHKIGTRESAGAVMSTFIGQGIHHIFIGPDHILFIIGLMLLGGGLWRLLKIVTAFTIAHSITLALATQHLLNPPTRLIEPIIALSIVVVGLFNIVGVKEKGDLRVLFAFVFGLVHGFGFASVLSEFGLPSGSLGVALFSFNVGV